MTGAKMAMTFLKLPWDRLRVYLAADCVGAVCERGLLRRRFACASAAVPPDDARASPWAPAVRALAGLIAAGGWRGLPIDVALSSEFVRFAFVPGIRRRLTSLEIQELARGLLARVLGDTAMDWSVRHCAADRTGVLGAAAEKPLLAALEDLAHSCRGALRSVSPLWSCAINRQRARLGRRTAWLVLSEPRVAAFGLLEHGRWRTMRAKVLDAGRGVGVSQWLERESRYLGAATRDVIVVGGASERDQFAPEWKVAYLPDAPARGAAMAPACRHALLAGH